MLTCEQTEHLFDAYLDGELSSSLRAEIHAHRLDCGRCNHQLALLECCADVVAGNAREPSLKGDFTDRIMAGMPLVKAPAAKGSPRLYRLFAPVAAAAAAVAITVLLVPPLNRKAPATIVDSVIATPVINADGRIGILTQNGTGQIHSTRFLEVPNSLAELMIQGGLGRTSKGLNRLRYNNEELRQLGKMVLLGTIAGLRADSANAEGVLPASQTMEEPATPQKPAIDQLKIERSADEFLPT